MKNNINLILDTHIWIWWIEQNSRLPISLKAIIESSDTTLAISAVSIYELLSTVARDRLQLTLSSEKWLEKATHGVDLTVLPVTFDIAVAAAHLPAIHGDPLDRLIIATAFFHQSQLISLDGNFAKYPELQGLLVTSAQESSP